MALINNLASVWFPKVLELNSLKKYNHSNAVVLMYHEVLPDDFNIPSWTIVRTSDFRQQMAYLHQNYDVVTIETAIKRIYEGTDFSPSKRPMIVITFDDGYSGNLHYAKRILQEFNLPFTVYIATAQVESGGYYWYDKIISFLIEKNHQSFNIATSKGNISYSSGHDFFSKRRWAAINKVLTELKKLSAEEREEIANFLGASVTINNLRMLTPTEVNTLASDNLVTIGCHTHYHDLLDEVPLDKAKNSVMKAQQLLREWTGSYPSHFSYPNGNYSMSIVKLVKDYNFASAVTTENRVWSAFDSNYQIPRVGIGRFDNLNLFRAKISGFLAR